MIVSVAAVISLDAKLTRHEEPDIYAWVSDEDQAHFRPLLASHQVVIMGRNTYEAVRPSLNLELPVKRIILTSQPETFSDKAVPDKLEFRNESSTELVKQLKQQGVETVLIVGGPLIISELLQNQLTDFLYITIEPRLFGQGTPLLADTPLDIHLRLIDSQQLNPQGTLLLKYKIQPDA